MSLLSHELPHLHRPHREFILTCTRSLLMCSTCIFCRSLVAAVNFRQGTISQVRDMGTCSYNKYQREPVNCSRTRMPGSKVGRFVGRRPGLGALQRQSVRRTDHLHWIDVYIKVKKKVHLIQVTLALHPRNCARTHVRLMRTLT